MTPVSFDRILFISMEKLLNILFVRVSGQFFKDIRLFYGIPESILPTKIIL
jgi:hypothetical protein